jgi:ankyrin repeat protein
MSVKSVGAILAALSTAAATPAFAGAAPDSLISAVMKSDHASIQSALAAKADPNARRPDQSTPLHWAVDRQDPESVRLLLAAKADPNAVDMDGATPLVIACELGDPSIVRQLIAAGAKVSAPSLDGITPIALCAGSSSPEALTALIDAGAEVNTPNKEGQTPVMWAASRGRADNVALLASRGAEINRATPKGFTPLFFAVQSGVQAAVEAVIQAGANVAYVSQDGTTALHLALLGNNFELATLLVNKGADVNRWDINGLRPLHVAATKNNQDLVRLLLAKGADPNGLTRQAYRAIQIDESAATAAKDAPWFKDDPSVKVVYRQGPGNGPVPPAPPPTTPLLAAAEAGSLDAMKLLVAAGAKADFRALDGQNLVFAAVNSGDPEVVRYALQLAPDVGGATKTGDTLMHVAVLKAKGSKGEELIRLLADKGAKLDAENARGMTPAEVAERRADPAIRQLYETLLKERSSRTAVAASTTTIKRTSARPR